MIGRFYHYTFLDGLLIGSEHPSSLGRPTEVVQHFVTAVGVRALLTLTSDFQDFGIERLTQHHVPMADVPTRAQVELTTDLVGEHLARGEPVWNHCQRGIDRTGTAIGAYLVTTGHRADRVIQELIARFPARRRTPQMLELWQPYADLIRSFSGTPRR